MPAHVTKFTDCPTPQAFYNHPTRTAGAFLNPFQGVHVMRKMPIVTTLVLLAAGTAQAEQQMNPAFKSIDADANGYVSQTEASGNSDLTSRWNELDKDKNNMLDTSEFSAFETGTPGETMKQAPMEQTPAPSTPRY